MRSPRWTVGVLGLTLAATSLTLAPSISTAAVTPATLARTVSDPGAGASGTADAALGNGLGRVLAGDTTRRRGATPSGPRLDDERLVVRDAQGRVRVYLTPQADADRAVFRRNAERLGFVTEYVDPASGTLQGFVPEQRAQQVAALAQTGTMVLAPRAWTSVGKATAQGVPLQGVDTVQGTGVDGTGITIGALSDSYDAATTALDGSPLLVHAAQDVATGDLPGTGNPRNPQPVVVVDDPPVSDTNTDEGRGMLQVAHDVAPGATLCFATALDGQLGFAANIRRLADPTGPCKADVVVDDIGYLDEPFFSDSALSDAIDDVAADGVHYFTAAGNDGVEQAWNSPVRLLPARTAVRGTNIRLGDVDPALYSGGLQDMDPGSGTDIAQTLTLGDGGGLLNLQWDDPVDLDGATLGSPLFSQTGEVTVATPSPTYTFTATPDQVGEPLLFRVDGIPSGSTDLVLTVTAPDGTTNEIDTGSSPEQLATTVKQAGDYTIAVSGFNGDTGDFTLQVLPVLAPSTVSTDFNVLVFDSRGNYLFPIADDNLLSGRPQELAGIDGPGRVQLVIARAGTGPVGATRLRNVVYDDAALSEYVDPLSPAMAGHTLAKGATAVAAVSPFAPVGPEFFTSPGGDLPVFFDSAGERLPAVEIRRVPQIASADGGNTTFFGSDSVLDADRQPNFFGTSAAAPQASGIAALALQQAGGGRSLSPAALRNRLQDSAFRHDLDPFASSGSAGGITLSARGGAGFENGTSAPRSMVSDRFFTLRYTGKVPLRRITLLGGTAAPTALGGRSGSAGLVFDRRHFDGTPSFRDDGYAFRVGSTSGGLKARTVRASYAGSGAGQAVRGQYRRMTLTFRDRLKRGQQLQFGVDRDLAISGYGGADEGNSADLLGSAVRYPQDQVLPGMRFVALRADGKVVRGQVANRIGRGFTALDGYGLVDARRAVLGTR